MKQNKGITLITLIMYIILTLVVLGILGALSRNFRGNLNNVNSKTVQEVEYDKLNTQLLKETKTESNLINVNKSDSTKIEFKNGNIYTYSSTDKAIYLNNNIKIAENIDQIFFQIDNSLDEQTLKMQVTINNKTTVSEYVIIKHSLKPGQMTIETAKYVDASENVAWIPEGFTISKAEGETQIDEGLVIYLINDKTNKEIENLIWSGEELETLKHNYDQFVWIPISHKQMNDMFICQSKTTTNGSCNITVENGIAKCTTHDSTQMAGRLYAVDYGENYKKEYSEVYTTEENKLREPDVVSYYDGHETCLGWLNNMLETTYDSKESFKEALQRDYNDIVAEIYATGGYYVGRYETSNLTTTKGTAVNVVAGTRDGINSINWYYMYTQQKLYASNKHLNSIRSSMMLGTCYDQMLEFVNEEGKFDVTAIKYAEHDLTENYNTGSKNTDVSNNIYDLEGNELEWTTEVVSMYRRVYRGGCYSSSKSASYRNNVISVNKYSDLRY